MAENSKIAWTDDTFNPWWGCARIGPGCDNCYAATLDKRTGGDYWDSDKTPRRTGEQNWNKPCKWNKQAEAAGVRRKVFCASMADVFDNRVPQKWRDDLWALVRETPNLDWIIVTKRIGNAAKMLPTDWGDGYRNVWLLITVVNQDEVNRDIPKLLSVRAHVHGLSVEPQLESILVRHAHMKRLDWVICGAESGPHRRPFDVRWARTFRDACHASQTAFFLKQIPGGTHKGVIEIPELDGQQWTQFPR